MITSKRPDEIKMSYTRISSYRMCPRQHSYKYNEFIYAQKVSKPLILGGHIHEILSVRANPSAVERKLDEISTFYTNSKREIKNSLGETYVEDIRSIIDEYTHIWKSETLPDETEHKFSKTIGKAQGVPINFMGYIDELYKYQSNWGQPEFIIGEHKTFKIAPNEIKLLNAEQPLLYAKAVTDEFGVTPRNIVWDYISSIPSEEPRLLKNGTLSTSNNPRITPYSWEKACDRYNLPESERQKASLYEGNQMKRFFKYVLKVNKFRMNSVYEDFVDTAKDIIRNNKTCVHDGLQCSWCDYQPLCAADLRGDRAERERLLYTEYVQDATKQVINYEEQGE